MTDPYTPTRQPVWEGDVGPRQPSFRPDPMTPTRQMAQSAAQKASDAYAESRLFRGRMDALEARADALETDNAELHARLARLEDQPPRVVAKRKAA